MATSNKRDVRLGVEIETAGEENLKRLAAGVRSLAQAGDEAAPQYIELANALERNADVARELAVFKTAAQAIDETSAAANQAVESAQRLRQEYQQQAEATQALQANQRRVAEALDATKRQLLGAAEQAAVAKNALKGADDATGALAAAATAAADRVAALKKQAGELGLDLGRAKTAAREASTALEKLADQSLRADEAARSQAAALRAQADTLERARLAAVQLGEDFTDVAAAQERLDAALRDGAGALQAAAAAEKLAAEQRQAQAAVDALTRDLDQQAEVVRGKLVPSLLAAAEAYDKEEAAIRESLALQQRQAAEATKQAALQQRLTQLREEDIAILRGETAERQRAQAVAESELATIREAEQFLATYNDRKREAALEALRFVEALEQEAAAADKASRRTAELNAQADKTARSKEYVQALAAAFDAVEQQAAQAATQVAKLQGYFDRLGQQRDVVSQAFGTTGVRSIQAIEQEMFKLQRALVTLQGEFSDGRISLADFERATGSAQTRLAALKREIETIPGDKSTFDQLADGANNLITKFGALTAALATVGFAIAPVIREFIALESTTRILTQVTGSSAEAAKQIEFLRSVAQRSGQAFGEVSQSYAKFAASALQAGLSTEQVQATFQSVALAAGNLGLNSDQAKRALEALGQIASKGTVSMEELRQQLGDALPGVLPLLAKQLGLTNTELNKLVEAGELSASSAIPALAKALESLGPKTGVVDGLVASFNRFKNTLFEAGTTLLEGPLGQGAGALLTAFAGALRDVAFVAVSASEGLKVVGRTIGLVMAAVTGGIKGVREFGEEWDRIALESAEKIVGFRDRAYESADAATAVGRAAAAAAPGVQAVSTAAAGAGAAAAAATPQQAALGAAVAGVGAAAAGAVAPQQQMAEATTQVGAAATQAFASVEQLKVAYRNAIDGAAVAAQTAKLAAEAKKTEGEALKEVAALTGNEVLVKRTAVDVANQFAAAVGAQAAAEQRQLDLAREFRVALEQKLLAAGKISEQDQKDLATRDEKLAKQAAEVQKTLEQAEALERQALAARLAGESLADNADRQAEFAAAAEQAASAVERARIALADGTGTQRQYRDALAESAFQQGRLADALADGSRRLEANSRIQTADTNVRVAGLKVKLEEIRNAEAKARADGDETRAARLKIEAKQAELEITRLNNESKRQEAQAALEVVQNMLREADAGRLQLTPEKRAELEARKLNAEAKLLEAEAAVVSEKRDEAEIERLKRLRSAIEATTRARAEGAAAASGGPLPNALGAMDDRQPWQKSTSGETIAQPAVFDNSYVFGLRDRLRRGEAFQASELPAIENALRAAESNARAISGSSVQSLSGVRDAEAWVMTLRQVLERAQGAALGSTGVATGAGSLGGGPLEGLQFNGGRGTSVFGGKAPGLQRIDPTDAADLARLGAAAAATTVEEAKVVQAGEANKAAGTQGLSAVEANRVAAANRAAAGRSITINLAGLGSTSINVASDADAERLTAMFRQIETAMARSGG